MERRGEQRTNLAADLLMQGSTPEDTHRAYSGIHIDAVVDAKTANGKAYKQIEFTDPDGQRRKLNVWDKKKWDLLSRGIDVDLSMDKNDKGFWNLSSLTPSAELFPEKPTEVRTEKPVFTAPVRDMEFPAPRSSEQRPQSSTEIGPRPPEKPLDEREYVMRSMNATLPTSTLLAAGMQHGIFDVNTYDEMMTAYDKIHSHIMSLHNQPKPDEGPRTKTK